MAATIGMPDSNARTERCPSQAITTPCSHAHQYDAGLAVYLDALAAPWTALHAPRGPSDELRYLAATEAR